MHCGMRMWEINLRAYMTSMITGTLSLRAQRRITPPLRGNWCPEPLVKTTEGDKRFVHLHCTTLRNTVTALGVN